MPDPALQIARPDRVLSASRQYRRPLGEILLDMGVLGPQQLMQALAIHGQCRAPIDRVCLAEGFVTEDQLLAAQSLQFGIRRLGPRDPGPDPSLAPLLPPDFCRDHAVMPWSRENGRLVLATSDPAGAEAALATGPELREEVTLALLPERRLYREITRLHGPALAAAAETRVPEAESCRDFLRAGPARTRVTALACALMALAVFLAPQMIFTLLALWAVLTMALSALLKLACLATMTRHDGTETDPPPEGGPGGRPDRQDALAADAPPPAAMAETATSLPRMSLLVPLFHESGVAGQLVARLARLDYPRGLLEVVLVLEDHDDQTREALDATDLPPWFRVVEVPEGRIRTKPRALNHALGLCRGEIVGIYDAEDAPERDQLLRVARAFQRGPPDLACIQGILDYYNAHDSWLARCFTIEYATWFRLVLPGLSRLRLAIPLGGTTVFLRRTALEELGGWDAHNVTEDADLGIRLARHGYRTELIPSVTQEEANDRLWPWVRQRSRWLKGYMVTYLVHMRNPALLWRQFGPRRFLGFQIFFLAALSQFLMGPLLWTFWLVPAGLPHPLASLFGPAGLMAVGACLLAGAATDLCAALLAVRATAHRGLGRWVPSLLFYFPLATLAAYKALWELVFQPFYWDKTEHGRSHAPELPEPGTEDGTAP